MAEDYDNNDRGAAFPPFQTQALVLQGKINDRGLDAKVVLIKDQTKAGKNLIEVYQKVGVLFPQEEKKSESAPDYTGPMDNGRPKKQPDFPTRHARHSLATIVSHQSSQRERLRYI
jgi:hypothetical protein